MVSNNPRTEKTITRWAKTVRYSRDIFLKLAHILLAIDLVDWKLFYAWPESLFSFRLQLLACSSALSLIWVNAKWCIPELRTIIHKHVTSDLIHLFGVLTLSHSAAITGLKALQDWYLPCWCEHISLQPCFTLSLQTADNCGQFAWLESFSPVFY